MKLFSSRFTYFKHIIYVSASASHASFYFVVRNVDCSAIYNNNNMKTLNRHRMVQMFSFSHVTLNGFLLQDQRQQPGQRQNSVNKNRTSCEVLMLVEYCKIPKVALLSLNIVSSQLLRLGFLE